MLATGIATKSLPCGMSAWTSCPTAQRPLTCPTLIRTAAQGSDGDAAAASAEELVQQLLSTDPQAADSVKRVADAARNVAELQMEQARLARALAEAQLDAESSAEMRERRAAAAAADTIAAGEVKAAAFLLQAAELEAQIAASKRAEASVQADTEAERIETVKAGAAAAVGATVATFPLVLANGGSSVAALATLFSVAASGAMFGLVYRYAVRTDFSNVHLKGGAVAAFGLVRGIAQAAEIIGPKVNSQGGELDIDTLGTAALAAGESMLIFGFACAALEAAFARGLVKPLERLPGSSSLSTSGGPAGEKN